MPTEQQASQPLHLALSNQSRSTSTAEVEVLIDGKSIARKTLEAKSQHAWQEWKAETSPGQHTLLVRDVKTGKEKTEKLSVDKPLWIAIMFTGDDFTIQVSETQIGFL